MSRCSERRSERHIVSRGPLDKGRWIRGIDHVRVRLFL